MKRLNLVLPAGGSTIAVWLLWGFAWSIGAIWLYAAIRPRYGPGPGTAVRAGLAAWFFSGLLATVAMVNLGIFGFNAVGFLWELAASIIATVAGIFRGHLLFAERVNSSRFAAELQRAMPVLFVTDLSLGVVLAIDGLLLVGIQPVASVLTVALGVGIALTRLLVEPSTTSASFNK